MAQAGEVVRINGVDARYAKHEIAHIRALIGASDEGRCTPKAAWSQISLLHGLKVELGAVLVDEHEEASIRRAFDAFDEAQREAEAA